MSQVLSRAYNSNLPNSLSNFPLETRDCTSRIPDADISTILFRYPGGANTEVLPPPQYNMAV